MSAERPHVLFVQGAGIRAGAERALMARLHALREQGIDATVAFLANGPFRREVERTGVEVIPIDGPRRLRDLPRTRAAVTALANLARERADVVEGCGEKMSVLAGWAARRAGRPAVFNLQDQPLRDPRATAIQLAGAAARPAATVVPSRWMRDALPHRLYPNARVIPNGLVFDDLPSSQARVRHEMGWSEETIVVGLFARLVAWKGAEVLLRAAAELAPTAPDLRFLLVGGTLYDLEPRFRQRLEELIRDLGLADRVVLTGHREDALALMLDCDLTCHCSYEPEPFGMVVVESMALGKATIGTRTQGPEELIDHGRTGILVDPGDVRALTSAIAGLLADDERRGRLAAAAADEARSRFSSDVIAEPLATLYRDLARSHPA